jgi:beta-lactamase superfamily II metal-dependent hydrolase
MGELIEVGYATFPSVKMFNYKKNKKGVKSFGFVKELLFGDYIKPFVSKGDYKRLTVTEGKYPGEYIQVRSRDFTGYIHEEDIQTESVLEVNFIDVGQGDGCHIVTPDDEHFLVDAGKFDNMYRFLRWRFRLDKAKNPPPPFTVVISHPDSDHYLGFQKVFCPPEDTAQKMFFNKVYHNGLVEGAGSAIETLGTIVRDENDKRYVTDLCDTQEEYLDRIGQVKHGDFIDTLEMTDADKASLRKGSDPIYDKNGLKIEVMGPVADVVDGKPALRVFGSKPGKTKNGHSVILKLTMGHMRILLGGDLNTEAEDYLFNYYSGADVTKLRKELAKDSLTGEKRKEKEAELDAAISKARETLEVDIAKSCHHGSADFTSEFLRVLNPIATIISSGDEESYAHPRPDTLGTIGKYGRGERPLIFSTELARSGKEFIDLNKIKNEADRKERAVTVYGMINVRTDGNRAIIAQKLESPADYASFDLHKLVWDEKKKEFKYVQKKE